MRGQNKCNLLKKITADSFAETELNFQYLSFYCFKVDKEIKYWMTCNETLWRAMLTRMLHTKRTQSSIPDAY